MFSKVATRHTQTFNQNFGGIWGMKLSFSEWFCGRTFFSEISFRFRRARRTSCCFQMWFWESLIFFIQCYLSWEVWNYCFRSEFWNEYSFQKVVSLSAMCKNHWLVCKCGLWTRSNIYIKCSNEIGKLIATSLPWTCLRKDLCKNNVLFGIFGTFICIQVSYLGSNSPFIKKSIQFREYNVSCLMWFYEGGTTTLSYKERYFREVLSISPLFDD